MKFYMENQMMKGIQKSMLQNLFLNTFQEIGLFGVLFDKEESNFVKLISRRNKVIYSHIDTGQNFFEWESNEHWDCIISNPPFKNKRMFFERALSFNKPFALIMTLTWLSDRAPALLFKDKGLQLLMFDKRMEFDNAPEDKGITFSSAYYCWNFLPKQIIIEELNKE